MNEESLFAAALEKSSTSERQAFLEEACGGDAGLRRRVEMLLTANEHTAGILERGPDAPTLLDVFPRESHPVGAVLAGRFKLREKLGEGGMGEVWVADQTEPVRRRVALKLIRPGLDSAHMLARFEQERQALALMDHPNIAKVLDAGVLPASSPRASAIGLESENTERPMSDSRRPIAGGRPYFVMELIRGLAITRFCDEAKLSPRQRLELFIPVCQAVQHAHQKGVIHRDLKPSNILVALYDGKPVPKVIDFGVAKATGLRLSEQSICTEVGAVIGTLEYMSPEQAELSNLDIDTRSDIYALGVILYELLTGSVPFSRKHLQSAALAEMLRVIKEVEPPRPSTRLCETETLPNVAADRQTEPRKLTALIRGELDWIVMKCLEKDRTRRYESANALALDLHRYLADEPVEASPPSTTYRLKKFLRRHRGPVLAASIILLLLVGGIVGTTVGLIEASRQRDDAEGARVDEAREKHRAVTAELLASDRLVHVEAAKRRADEALAIAVAVNNFLNNDLLGQADIANQPAGAERNRNITVRELLDRADKAVPGKFAGQPLVEAAVRLTLADSYLGLGEFALALSHAQEAVRLRTAKLGQDDPDTVAGLARLAAIYHAAGQTSEAITLYEKVRDARQQQRGAEHPDTLRTLSGLARTLQDAGRTQQAIVIFEQVHSIQMRTLGPSHPNTLGTLNNLAVAYQIVGRTADVISTLLRVQEAQTKELGYDHPHTLATQDNLANVYQATGQTALAIKLLEQSRDTRVQKLGAEHPHTLQTLSNLALAYVSAGRRLEAIELLEKVRDARVEKSGLDHPDTITSLGNLALAYWDTGQREQAIYLFQQAAAGIEKRSFVHEFAGPMLSNLCECHEELQQHAQAEPWRRKWLAVEKERTGSESAAYVGALTRLGLNLLAQQKHADADPHLRECLALLERKQPEGWTTFYTKSLLGSALMGQKKYADAEPLLLQGYSGMKERESKIPIRDRRRLPQALAHLVELYEAMNRKDEAARWRKELEKSRSAGSAPMGP